MLNSAFPVLGSLFNSKGRWSLDPQQLACCCVGAMITSAPAQCIKLVLKIQSWSSICWIIHCSRAMFHRLKVLPTNKLR